MLKPTEQKLSHLVACVVFVLIAIMPTSGQTKDRVVAWPPYPIGRIDAAGAGIKLSPITEALEIVAVRVADRSVTIGQPFAADEAWLRSLTFRVKNISGQPIIGARISFGLPETKTEERTLAFSLEYGQGLSSGSPADEQKIVMPGEEFELKFNDARYQGHKRFVAERSSITSFSKVWLGITTVKFADGTIWGSGCLRSSNPSNSCTPHGGTTSR